MGVFCFPSLGGQPLVTQLWSAYTPVTSSSRMWRDGILRMTGHFLMHVDWGRVLFQDPLVLEAVVGKKKKKLSRKINQNSAYSFTPGIQTVPEYHTSKKHIKIECPSRH